jgi:hypothetical protein
MSILAYCIVASSSAAMAPETGIRNAPLLEVEEEGLRAFYTEYKASAEGAREDALAFFAVNRAIFRDAAIIPFRFPTVLAGEEELTEHLIEHATQYASALQKLADMVQMEVRLTMPPEKSQADSGAGYLKEKQQRAKSLSAVEAAVRKTAGAEATDWKYRETREGMRCYALVERNHAAEFAKRIAKMKAEKPVTLAVTGPWPATEFIG